MDQQLIAVILSALLVQSISATPLPGFLECVFNGRYYDIGESFHPIVNVDGQEYEAVCYNCTCQSTAIAECEEVYCPDIDCPFSIRLDGTCCPICLSTGVEMPAGPKQCLYEGLDIPHGEVFHPVAMVEAVNQEMDGGKQNSSSHNTTISPVNPFCTSCQCDDGVVECTDVSALCPPLSCDQEHAVLVEHSCCMECPSVPPTTPPPGAKKTCFDAVDRSTYNHGDVWHPLFNLKCVECINCTCNDGYTSCKKEECPEVPFCAPGEFIQEPVVCCPHCKPGGHASPPTTTAKPVMLTAAPSCNTKDYIINIFKHSKIDSLAVENNETNIVQQYLWTPTDSGDLMMSIVTFTSNQFREMKDFDNFEFVGKTLLRRVNGLSTREAKREKISRCMSNCSTLVENMLRPVTQC